MLRCRFHLLSLVLVAALLALWTAPLTLHATHGLAGEITYRYVPSPDGSFSHTYDITLTTYLNPCQGADECRATIEAWVLTSTGFQRINIPALVGIPRSNGFPGDVTCEAPCTGGEPMGEFLREIPPDGSTGRIIKKSVYTVRVNFGPGAKTIQLRYSFSARLNNVRNIPQSGTLNWYVGTLLFDQPTLGANNSPVFNSAPYDDACPDQPWTHNPAVYDLDGDSLVFTRVASRVYGGISGSSPRSAPGFEFPDQISPGANNRYTVNPQTGQVFWRTPQEVGTYNVGLLVEEYRNGVKIGEVLRELAIIVQPCANRPPQIEALFDTCLTVPALVNYSLRIRDPDPLDSLYFYLNSDITSASRSLPFQFGASIIPPNDPSLAPQARARMPAAGPGFDDVYPIQANFLWNVGCADVRREAYTVDLYASDNRTRGVQFLTDAHVTRIKLLPPPPRNLVVTPLPGRRARLTWQPPNCDVDNVALYQIWRSTDSSTTRVDTCCNGTGGPGYQLVAQVPRDSLGFTDGLAAPLPFRGRYCYTIVALHVPRAGLFTPGCPSNQACFNMRRDAPQLERVDVGTTDPAIGAINLRWRLPDTTLVSAVTFPPPYRYRVLRAQGTGSIVLRETAAPDTTFTATGLNTLTTGHAFRIEMLDRLGNPVITSEGATSIFLSGNATDTSAVLSWQWGTPWVNDSFVVYQVASLTSPGPGTRVGSVRSGPGQSSASFEATGYTVGDVVYFYVESFGNYSSDPASAPVLRNRSNRVRVVIRDNIPPCPPIVTGEADCEAGTITFRFTPPGPCGDDIARFTVRYRRSPDAATSDSVGTVTAAEAYSTGYVWRGDAARSLAGCFTFVPVDGSGNAGEPTELLCLGASCTEFQLPNVFTPNGDGQNDVFRPIEGYGNFSVQGIVRIRAQIFDRSGRLLHTSTDPRNLWDGRVGGSEAVPGVYFYRVEADVESRSQGQPIVRVGTVTLLR